MERQTPGQWALDVGVAVLVAAAGLIEVWLPMESAMGDGSPVVSSIGIVTFAALLTQRRARPWVALSALFVWPVIGIATGGEFQTLFFGQLVPFLVLVFSCARHGNRAQRWAGAAGMFVSIVVADLTIDLLQEPGELLFHWAGITLTFLVGNGLRIAAEKAASEAVRAHEAETAARERELSAITEERARIARELHDIVAHSVGVIIVQAGAAEQVVEEDPEFTRRALSAIRSTGTSALAEMRRTVTMLRAPEPQGELTPQPGVAALPDLVDAARGAGLAVDLEVIGDAPVLPAGLDLTAYRIVQEALTNVRRHSAATRAAVAMTFGDQTLDIRVSDRGPSRDGSGEPGHGIIGMRERVALFGGQIETIAGEHGFTVHAVLPMERA